MKAPGNMDINYYYFITLARSVLPYLRVLVFKNYTDEKYLVSEKAFCTCTTSSRSIETYLDSYMTCFGCNIMFSSKKIRIC